ncbi:MAG: antibiotic biosynthesis monooxygenase family protein [Desulfobaccales bacterium]
MVKVLLERTIKGKHVKEITRLLRMLRVLAMQQPGYISGETLHEIDAPNNYLVISAWYSREDWQAWLANQERQKLQSELDGYMEAPTRFRVYTY